MRRLLTVLAAMATLLVYGTPAQAQQPGLLIGQEAVPSAPQGMKAWRIRYWSTNDRGQREQMTGMVVAPDYPPSRKGRPVLAWAHGTWGIADKCTPSRSANFFEATPALRDMVGRGYVVVAPDYAGLGTDTVHPYLVGSSAAHSVLDAVRSARAISEAGASGRFAVWGESQGGHAALWTGQLARSYAPELELAGVAAAAPPTDLLENLTGGTDPSVRAFLTAFTAHSWSQHFGISLRTLGSRSTGDIIDRIGRNNCVTLGAKPRIGTIIGIAVLRARLKNVDLGRISPWREIARDNSPAPRNHGVPILIAQNPKDVIVAPEVTRDFARRLCRDGAKVRSVTINGEGGHPTSAQDSAAETLDWIGARFAGERPPSDCNIL